MRIVVTGATGNVGTSVLEALGRDARVKEIVGVARRIPAWTPLRTRVGDAPTSRATISARCSRAPTWSSTSRG